MQKQTHLPSKPPCCSWVRTSSSPSASAAIWAFKVSYHFLRQTAARRRAAITHHEAHLCVLMLLQTRMAPLAEPKDPASSPATERRGRAPAQADPAVCLQEGAPQFERSQCQMSGFDPSFLLRGLSEHIDLTRRQREHRCSQLELAAPSRRSTVAQIARETFVHMSEFIFFILP